MKLDADEGTLGLRRMSRGRQQSRKTSKKRQQLSGSSHQQQQEYQHHLLLPQTWGPGGEGGP